MPIDIDIDPRELRRDQPGYPAIIAADTGYLLRDSEGHDVDQVLVADLQVMITKAGLQVLSELAPFALRVVVGDLVEPLALDRLDEAGEPAIDVVELEDQSGWTNLARVVEPGGCGLPAVFHAVVVARVKTDEAFRARVRVYVGVGKQVTGVDHGKTVGRRHDDVAARVLVK